MTESTVALNPEVVDCIKTAIGHTASAYHAVRLAADAAANEIDDGKPITEAVGEVVSRYSEVFGDDHNTKAVFKDLLTLHYAGSNPVSITEGKGDKAKEIHTTAQEATDLSKHKMRAAAKAVREDYGVGRKEGGGRTPRQTVAEKASAVVSFQSMLDTLLSTPENIESFKAMLKQRGYQLRKVSQ